LVKGRSPFRADRNHVHHKLLSMGFSHLKATFMILLANIIIVAIVFSLNNWGIIDLMLLILIVALVISVLPEIMYFIKLKRQQIS
jgi:UDP-GlcNAc:undecaprenyl-phosphate/decaprenyl-phosphate GlcNAc-1-phosphate transferase